MTLTSLSPAPEGLWSRRFCSCSRRVCVSPCPAPGRCDGGTFRPSAAVPAFSCTSPDASPAAAPAEETAQQRHGVTQIGIGWKLNCWTSCKANEQTHSHTIYFETRLANNLWLWDISFFSFLLKNSIQVNGTFVVLKRITFQILPPKNMK